MVLKKFGWTFDVRPPRMAADEPSLYVTAPADNQDDLLAMHFDDMGIAIPVAFRRKGDAAAFIREIVRYNQDAFQPSLRNKTAATLPVTAKMLQIRPYVAILSKK